MAAGLHAIVHLADSLAIIRAGLANFSADAAGKHVTRRTAQHEIRRGVADLHAVGHELKMLGCDMRAARLEAVLINHVLTGVVALGTGLDTSGEIVAVDI